MTTDAIIAFTTVADEAAARMLADRLVAERLAACVQIVPGLRSVYRWEGAVRHDDEVQLVIKSVAGNVDAIAALLHEHHPYDLPELVAVRIDAGAQNYLDWIAAEVT
jgi:periplasmic divalent cation tolerance protein